MKSMFVAALATFVTLATAGPAIAQEPRILVYTPWDWRRDPIDGALSRLEELRSKTFLTDTFIERLREREWELIVIRSYEVWPRANEILEELELHLGRGGRLLIQHAELDRWPLLQEFLGLENALNLAEPADLSGTEPYHPSIDESVFAQIDPTLERWPDVGDGLVPGRGTYVVAEFAIGGAAVVVTRATQIIVNGAEWDAYGDAHIILADQMKWLLSCPPDLDGSGVLDFFDFLEFQNLFAAGDPAADFAYDRKLDFFDFLEFQSAFAAGCPRSGL
jgi:hypothetical protein